MIELFLITTSVEHGVLLKTVLEYLLQGINYICLMCIAVLFSYILCFCTSLRWRLFRRPIIAKAENVVIFAKAAIALHNFLRCKESSVYCPPGFVDGEDGEGNLITGSWREEGPSSGMLSVATTSSNR